MDKIFESLKELESFPYVDRVTITFFSASNGHVHIIYVNGSQLKLLSKFYSFGSMEELPSILDKVLSDVLEREA